MEQDTKTEKTNRYKSFLINLANIYLFTSQAIGKALVPPYEPREILRQCYLIGVKTFPLVGFTSFLVGIVFTRQSRPSLMDFGAESWLPALVSIAIVRGLGPLVTALICAGKVGSNIGAELGSMNVTEQIDAMEVSGTDPFRFLVVTRVTATAVMVPLLVIYADALGLLGSFVATAVFTQTSLSLFFNQAFEAISFLDIFSSVFKGFLFGTAIGLVSTYCGYNSSRGTVGVGRAANTSVVTSMFMVFVLDLLSLQIIELFR